MGDTSVPDLQQIIRDVEGNLSRLETILRQLPLAVMVADAPHGRIVLQNEHAERILQHSFSSDWSVDAHRDYQGMRPDGSILEPEDWPLTRALRHGEIVSREEIGVVRGDGSRGTILVNAAPLRDANGTIAGAVVVFDDITLRHRHETALAFLSQASDVLSESLDYGTTLSSVVDMIVPRLADWCVVDIVDEGGAIRRLAMKHREPALEALLDELEKDYPHDPNATNPPVSVIRSGEPTFAPRVTEFAINRAARGTRHLELLQALDVRSYLCVPLIARGRSIGAISLVYSTSGRVYDQLELSLARELAGRIAVAIDNARLFEAEQVSRARAEEARRRLALLARASQLLSSSADYGDTLGQLSRLAVPALADLCIIDIVGPDGRFQNPIVAHATEDERLPRDVSFRTGTRLDADDTFARILQRGEPVIVDLLTEDLIREVAPADVAGRLIAAGCQSALIVPMLLRESTLGAMTFVACQPRRYGEADLPLMRNLAERAAMAIGNARLLRESQLAEARYRGLIEHAGDTILVADSAGRLIDANPAATDLLGYSRDELLAMEISDIVARGVVWSTAEFESFKQLGHWAGELDLRRRSGDVVPVEAKASILTLGNESLYLSVIRDISHRRASEMMQREFMTVVTHDLKSPLTSIKGFAQLMQRRQEYSHTATNAIVGQAEHLERLINDLLDAARLEAGRSELHRSRIDLTSLLRRVAAYNRAMTHSHEITVHASSHQIIGWWDEDRVTQVVQNLVSNAINYSPDGGAIAIRLGERLDVGRRWAYVDVQDSGIGIPAAAQLRIFERFYRHDEESSRAKGLGLGLYICRSLVEAHGGTISVSSEPGAGSTFTFTLPLDNE